MFGKERSCVVYVDPRRGFETFNIRKETVRSTAEKEMLISLSLEWNKRILLPFYRVTCVE